LRSALGDLRFDAGDYVFVPPWTPAPLPARAGAQAALAIDRVPGRPGACPRQWRNETGQAANGCPFLPPRLPARPASSVPSTKGLRQPPGQARGASSTAFTNEHSPLDVVGWDGTVYPFAFPILRFQPRVGLVHLPPTWHGDVRRSWRPRVQLRPATTRFSTPMPCPAPIRTLRSIATSSSSIVGATSPRAGAWDRAASRTTRRVFPTAPTPVPTKAASDSAIPTSWR